MKTNNYSYNDFTYLKNYDSKKESVIEHSKIKPENIFKFYACSEYNVNALINGFFYASNRIDLNDCLDSSTFLWYTSEKLDYIFYEKLFDYLPSDKIKELYQADANCERLCHTYITNLFDVVSNLIGIISTSGKEGNILMWPHYTQEKGYQIKFNTQKLEESIKKNLTENEEYLGLFPVNYCEKLSPIDIFKYNQMHVPLYYATNVKSKKWDYENEWRFVIGKQNMGIPYSKAGLNPRPDYFVRIENRYVYYDKELIEGITVGMNFFNARQFELEWLDGRNIKIKPKKSDSNWEYESHIKLLNYIITNLKDKFYHSGVRYHLDDDNCVVLIRTKEKMEINKLEDDSFILTRTDIVIDFIE